jgi:DNA repair protein RecO (recombination protein O)
MGIVTTRAVVLQTYRYSDTSKILRLMTLEHGPCSALARGALRPKSRFGGLLEPFSEGDVTLYMKEGRDLHALSSFELVRERRALGVNLGSYTAASVMCELVMRLAPEHRDDRLYRTLTDGLDALMAADAARSRTAGLRQIWALVATLGFQPELGVCVACGRPIGRGRARFDFEAGGLGCLECAPTGPTIEPNELASLRGLVEGGPLEVAVAGPQGRWLSDFIRYHMAEGSQLRSLPFLRQLA